MWESGGSRPSIKTLKGLPHRRTSCRPAEEACGGGCRAAALAGGRPAVLARRQQRLAGLAGRRRQGRQASGGAGSQGARAELGRGRRLHSSQEVEPAWAAQDGARLMRGRLSRCSPVSTEEKRKKGAVSRLLVGEEAVHLRGAAVGEEVARVLSDRGSWRRRRARPSRSGRRELGAVSGLLAGSGRTRKRGRGPTINTKLAKKKAQRKEIDIQFPPPYYKPCGKHAKLFKAEVTVCIRQHAPLRITKWKDISEDRV
ncbi:hypothetical protein J5N97_022478 [Dioscorea zingiberensis]|uniref:Uncharacterized protein n=1 Tax=Dioscorea zingiberensis TaxID=325984 RepID=A0A9D5HAK6_9LILI|nr:hypothetical protein J5N97_022478 [Dioscorea zingiberensis]